MPDRPRMPACRLLSLSFSWSLSTAARVAIVAGLIGTLLAGGFAFWLRREVYETRYAVAEKAAQDDLVRLRMSIMTNRSYQRADYTTTQTPYEIADSSGQLIRASDILRGYQGSGPVLPDPRPGRLWVGDVRVPLRGYDPALTNCLGASPDDWSCNEKKRLNGRNIKVFR